MSRTEITLGKSVVSLSPFMVSLMQEDIDLLKDVDSHDTRIVACGVDPKDGIAVFVTLNSLVYTFDPKTRYIPEGLYLPTRSGQEVFLPNTKGRWPGISKGFYVDSSWILERSKSAMEESSLYVKDTYLCDISSRTAETDNS